MDNSKLLLTIAVIAVVVYVLYVLLGRSKGYGCNAESFWGGYFPVPYLAQPLTRYGRSGFDAATDAPGMLVDPEACPVSPYYCERCRGYRCCCH